MLCCHGGDNIKMGGARMDDLTVRMMEGYDSDEEWRKAKDFGRYEDAVEEHIEATESPTIGRDKGEVG